MTEGVKPANRNNKIVKLDARTKMSWSIWAREVLDELGPLIQEKYGLSNYEIMSLFSLNEIQSRLQQLEANDHVVNENLTNLAKAIEHMADTLDDMLDGGPGWEPDEDGDSWKR